MPPCWDCLCDIDAQPLIDWLAKGGHSWPFMRHRQPQWLRAPDCAMAIVEAVLRHMPDCRVNREYVRLSRVMPGNGHEFHADDQPGDWVTRIHVPIVTNPGCWFMFEMEGTKVHFEVGKAYTFNTRLAHAFDNDGATERVHLIFDVLRNEVAGS